MRWDAGAGRLIHEDGRTLAEAVTGRPSRAEAAAFVESVTGRRPKPSATWDGTAHPIHRLRHDRDRDDARPEPTAADPRDPRRRPSAAGRPGGLAGHRAVSYQSHPDGGRLGVAVPVFCLPPAGQLDAATADARRALDVVPRVAADPRVTEATAKRDRLAAALERDRAAAKEARQEADRPRRRPRGSCWPTGDDPDPAEKLRDAATAPRRQAGQPVRRTGRVAERRIGRPGGRATSPPSGTPGWR